MPFSFPLLCKNLFSILSTGGRHGSRMRTELDRLSMPVQVHSGRSAESCLDSQISRKCRSNEIRCLSGFVRILYDLVSFFDSRTVPIGLERPLCFRPRQAGQAQRRFDREPSAMSIRHSTAEHVFRVLPQDGDSAPNSVPFPIPTRKSANPYTDVTSEADTLCRLPKMISLVKIVKLIARLAAFHDRTGRQSFRRKRYGNLSGKRSDSSSRLLLTCAGP